MRQQLTVKVTEKPCNAILLTDTRDRVKDGTYSACFNSNFPTNALPYHSTLTSFPSPNLTIPFILRSGPSTNLFLSFPK
jgi:hypothetical protein